MVEKGSQFSLSHGFTPRQWLQTASVVTVMCITLGAAWAIVQLYSQPWIRMLAVSLGLLIQYVCLRYKIASFRVEQTRFERSENRDCVSSLSMGTFGQICV